MNQSNCSKWKQMLAECEQQFTELPKWAQKILIQDISETIQTRIATMQKAQARMEGGSRQ